MAKEQCKMVCGAACKATVVGAVAGAVIIPMLFVLGFIPHPANATGFAWSSPTTSDSDFLFNLGPTILAYLTYYISGVLGYAVACYLTAATGLKLLKSRQRPASSQVRDVSAVMAAQVAAETALANTVRDVAPLAVEA